MIPTRCGPGLLVSVRSAAEARAAVEGGAAVIDVKEPDRGPLGRADPTVWQAVRAAVPAGWPVSVALGELPEWRGRPAPDPSAFDGLAFRKLGLAGAGPDWAADWDALRRHLGPGPPWVAVVYGDWADAAAPEPVAVVDEALRSGCAGVLFDTWGKARPGPWDRTWSPLLGRVQSAGRLVALAGGLDAAAIRRLAPLGPDLFALRGAACAGGDRRAGIDAQRVAALRHATQGPTPGGNSREREARRPAESERISSA